jgi:RNA-binding protein YlmH
MHFRTDERPFVERVLDWINQSLHRSQLILTDFLNPREQDILKALVRRETGLHFLVDGGTSVAERCRVVISPDFIPIDSTSFQLSYLRIQPTTEKQLEHRDVLGAILGFGLRREKIGDIHPHPSGCDVVVANEIAPYILLQLQKVSKYSVYISEIERDELCVREQQFDTRVVSVSSMRLDAILAEGYRLSRSKSVTLIKNGKCKVNWKLVDSPSYMTQEGDWISLRGYGRLNLAAVEGVTKKGRQMVRLNYLI